MTMKLKKLLEGYAWERKDGQPLPTLEDVQNEYNQVTEQESELPQRWRQTLDKYFAGSADYETKNAKMNSRKKVTKDQLINIILPGKVYQIWQTPEKLIIIEDDKENWYELI